MKFEINNHTWEIFNLPNDEMQQLYIEITGNKDGFGYGATCYNTQEIYINKDTHKECIINTLKHELTHCYLWTYGFRMVDFNEEVVCDIVANSNEFINEIVTRYKTEVLKMACGRKKGGRRK